MTPMRIQTNGKRRWVNASGMGALGRGIWGLALLLMLSLFIPHGTYGRIYIDINAPSVRKFRVAIPDFRNLNRQGEFPELSTALPEVLANDLDLSGYFIPMDKKAFLDSDPAHLTMGEIQFRNWSVIGAELLITGAYTCIGSRLEVEIRLFDVFQGKSLMGKRALGDTSDYRRLMHRLGNEIIAKLTGNDGIFLSKLAFVGKGTGHKEIYVSDYDGYNVQRITTDQSIALLPRWSPDGKKLTYNSYRDGWPMLYLRDMETGKTRRISEKKGLNIGASWAPSGENLALTLSLDGNPDIFTIDLNGKILERLTDHWAIDVSPVFSPDGKKMAFVSGRSGSPQIYVRDLATGREDRVTFEGSYNTSPTWSKLNRIAFVSMNNSRFQIYSMDIDGGGLTKLTESEGNNEDPCWSPDGRYLVFSSNREGQYHLYIMNANGQNQRRITYTKGDQTSPSWIN